MNLLQIKKFSSLEAKRKSLKPILSLVLGIFLIPSLGLAQAQEFQQNTDATKKAGFTLFPTNPTVVDYLNIVVELKPGDTVKESITLKSSEPKEESFILYPTEPTIDKNGVRIFKQKDDEKENVGKWLILDEPEVTIKPTEEKNIDLTITVPKDAVLGAYDGAIAVENLQPSAKYPGILISRRIIMHVKVTVTDTPQTLARIGEANIFANTTPYFWISIGIFVSSMAYFIYAKKSEKNAKLKDPQK